MTPSWLPTSGTAGVGAGDKKGWGGGRACSLRAGPWLLTELLCHVADPEDLSQSVRTPALGDTGRVVALSEQDLMAAFGSHAAQAPILGSRSALCRRCKTSSCVCVHVNMRVLSAYPLAILGTHLWTKSPFKHSPQTLT